MGLDLPQLFRADDTEVFNTILNPTLIQLPQAWYLIISDSNNDLWRQRGTPLYLLLLDH